MAVTIVLAATMIVAVPAEITVSVDDFDLLIQVQPSCSLYTLMTISDSSCEQ